MTLGQKIRHLRELEGALRGLGRAMTQAEIATAMRDEIREPISQAYLSQIENGARRHLSHATRQRLATFFKVHPGYLVDDPEGYHPELLSQLRVEEQTLDAWLLQGSQQFQGDRELSQALERVANGAESRRAILLLDAIRQTPGLEERLIDVLRPGMGDEQETSDASAEKRNG